MPAAADLQDCLLPGLSDDVMLGQGGRVNAPLRTATRPTVQTLAIPNGFTLTIGGTLAFAVGRDGYPGWLAVWLFVVGGCVAFCIAAALSNAHRDRDDTAGPVCGPTVFNLVPVVVVPIVEIATNWIGFADAQFALAGFLAVGLYVSGFGALTAMARARRS